MINYTFQSSPKGIGFFPGAIQDLGFAEYGLYMAIATRSGGLTFIELLGYSKESASELESLLETLVEKEYIIKEEIAK